MSYAVSTYSPSDVIMTFGGKVVEGWDKISVIRLAPSFRMVQGIKGKNTRVRVANTAAEINITVPQTSEINSIFSQIVAFDEQYGTARIEVIVRDVLGGEVFSSNSAFLESISERSYEADITARAWKLSCTNSSFSQTSGGAVGRLIDFASSIIN